MANQPIILGLSPSFGFGDRIGLATTGHVLAMQEAGLGIRPIFAQQSIREMTRTGRSPRQVMTDALAGAEAAGWTGPQGADADHLKTPADVDATAAAGFVFFTIDPSEKVDPAADGYPEDQLRAHYAQVRAEVDWMDRYVGKAVTLSTGTKIQLTERDCMKAAVKYGLAINLAVGMSDHIAAVMKKLAKPFEIELSVDETPQPTTLAEHYIIADQVLRRGMKMVSLAPRFIGDFEKGVDYKGDLGAFEKSAADHAAIAAMLGPYKLSLHSGSDKLSVYGILAKVTKGLFHVKTAGTSYLEALRVLARHDGRLFRRIIEFARLRYGADKATYHVSATLASAPPPEQVADPAVLEKLYLECWPDVPVGRGFTAPGRQILHCTFGSVLTDPTMQQQLRGVLLEHRGVYDQILAEHFSRHLNALAAAIR
jgi:hypothetical protein